MSKWILEFITFVDIAAIFFSSFYLNCHYIRPLAAQESGSNGLDIAHSRFKGNQLRAIALETIDLINTNISNLFYCVMSDGFLLV